MAKRNDAGSESVLNAGMSTSRESMGRVAAQHSEQTEYESVEEMDGGRAIGGNIAYGNTTVNHGVRLTRTEE